jgi:predicted DNA-binding protein (MmcQ/YjbR family)
MGGKPRIKSALRSFALGLPETTEEFPWGERVIKVRGKVFVFLGTDAGADVGFSVKLPRSGPIVLGLPNATPTGYGLGKSGWVSVRFAPGEVPPLEALCSWLEESYRAVAPKTLVKALDEKRGAR